MTITIMEISNFWGQVIDCIQFHEDFSFLRTVFFVNFTRIHIDINFNCFFFFWFTEAV